MTSAKAWRSAWFCGRRPDPSPVSIAINPLLLTVLKEPVTGNHGKAVERKAHGFTNAHESIDGSHSGQHRGRVAALLLALFEPSVVFEDGQHRV